MGLRHGAALVPAFAFGQSEMFHWRRPGPPLVPTWVVERISRAIGCAPLLLWGRWGLPIPCPVSCLAMYCRGQYFVITGHEPCCCGDSEGCPSHAHGACWTWNPGHCSQ